MLYDFTDRLDPSSTAPLAVALVSRHGIRPNLPTGLGSRLVQEPSDIRTSDDVVLFYGPGMAQELRRFSAETEADLPPAAVLAPWLDWDDVSLALDHGAVSYLLENRYAFLLDEALLCTAHGTSMLDPAIAAEQVRVASRARAEASRAEASRVEAEPPAVGMAPSANRLPELSRREREVMHLLASGLGVREIAAETFLTEKTVRNYLSRIYSKLNVRGRSEAILCWLGILSIGGAMRQETEPSASN